MSEIFVTPPNLRARYARLALIVDDRPLTDEAIVDPDTLIVTCNWLLAEELTQNDYDCIYFERGLLNWDIPEKLGPDIFIHSNGWVYDASNKDVTVIDGVSLGKALHGEIFVCMMNFYRLDRALRQLIDEFSCREIIFYEFASELNVLSKPERCSIVEAVCKDAQILFSDRSDDSDGLSSIADRAYAKKRQIDFRECLARVYELSLSGLSSFLAMWRKKRDRVLVLVNTNLLGVLLTGITQSECAPVVSARAAPKKFMLIWKCLKAGVVFSKHQPVRLSAAQEKAIDDKSREIVAYLENHPSHLPTTLRRIIANRMAADELKKTYTQAMEAAAVCDRHRPCRVVVDGVRNPPNRFYCEQGKNAGIEVDYIWHSPHIPIVDRVDSLGGEPRTEPMVTRCLSWGRVNDMWLDDISARQPRAHVGSPLALAPRRQGALQKAPSQGANVLVLQYTPLLQDLRGLNSYAFVFFVRTVRMLKSLGYNVRFKLHPGPGRWKPSYYENVARAFQLDCPLSKSEPYQEALSWADFVVGPILSGAMFETLAAGKPYYPFLIPVDSMDTRYYGDYPIYETPEQLAEDLKGNVVPDAEAILEEVYSIRSIPDPVQRFWATVASTPGRFESK
ncbi:hypothetical protein L2D14_02625 [Thalassospiraceae bacterium LMO-JJ14]|nr:hypothetical protein L2D14_02625 [Thalassospiraceae bacterium LMO-JJ14]